MFKNLKLYHYIGAAAVSILLAFIIMDSHDSRFAREKIETVKAQITSVTGFKTRTYQFQYFMNSLNAESYD